MKWNDLLSRRFASITADSRSVVPGSVFVAVPGVNRNGSDYIPEAISRGAGWIVTEEPLSKFSSNQTTPFIQVADARAALAELAATFYGHPSHSLTVVGITGTSGKTTTSYLVESILNAAGHKTGVIGTVNFRFGDRILASTHTTPDAVELQRLLAAMKEQGCTAVVMEVSSHALRQHRVGCTAFDAVAFTNLSPEHQDFHPDMEHYFRSKAMLFQESVDCSAHAGKRPACAINADEMHGKRLLGELATRQAAASGKFRIIPYSLATSDDLNAPTSLVCDLHGIRGSLAGVPVDSELIGRFNAENLATAVALAQGLGISSAAISRGIHELACVPGRLERVPNAKNIHVFVDYAHKPDALEKVLHALKDLCTSMPGARLITVFGCGGDRDRKKRPVMGRLAVELSDQAWITSDNPRTEDPAAIIREVLAGTQGAARTPHVEADRKAAITAALRSARPQDVVLIAGKGHEDYQIIADPTSPGGTRKIHFDDREIAAEVLNFLPIS